MEICSAVGRGLYFSTFSRQNQYLDFTKF